MSSPVVRWCRPRTHGTRSLRPYGRTDLMRLVLTLLRLLPGVAFAQSGPTGGGVMIPGELYRLSGTFTVSARVIFADDGRVLVWQEQANAPTEEGGWRRLHGKLCFIESDEFAPICLVEVDRGAGAFSLTRDGESMEFMPIQK